MKNPKNIILRIVVIFCLSLILFISQTNKTELITSSALSFPTFNQSYSIYLNGFINQLTIDFDKEEIGDDIVTTTHSKNIQPLIFMAKF